LIFYHDIQSMCRGHSKAGPCSDESDDEDCDDSESSGIDDELDVDIRRDQSTQSTAARTTTTTNSQLSTTSQTGPLSLLTMQLPPREASVFLDDLDNSDVTGDDSDDTVDQTQQNGVQIYDGGSHLTASLGMNIGLIVGIAAGIVILTLILSYAVCKYRGGRARRLGRGKAPRHGKNPPGGVTAETGLLSRVQVSDHAEAAGRKMTTTPLLCRDVVRNVSASQKSTVNGYDSDARRKRKGVNEWYV